MFKNTLILCTGNICRSPVAEAFLKRISGESTKVLSAGVNTKDCALADDTCIELLKQKGIDITGHRSQKLSSELLVSADLVLVMEKKHIEEVSRVYPEARGKLKLLGHWQRNKEVLDPYKKSREVYMYAVDLIEELTNDWKPYLQ
ncbi:low molecular weight protein-tyrosine-phosphatase [Kangiella sediminilitoris]|uniref:protein-tyrosine-phosphatase n=1 Tax=Kangiella sediminilitoris TaxID=1144748 RepID=A0A1B3BBL0_9GAMM|nr:low molecular weight protein-tyrosine-phosphatase [Kangiella sediminilitoris]AOE50176.1 Phosphotyrosine protein phosphatase [Kangiella sediminilitoris]